MRYQEFPWSCGAATVVNALRRYGIRVAEGKVRAIAGTVPPSKCKHCREYAAAAKEFTCKCKTCTKCKYLRKLWSRLCKQGTDQKGLIKALRHFGGDTLTASEYESQSRDNAWQWLHGTLVHGRVALLCIASWDHWVLVFGTSGDAVNIFDPYPSKRNKAECGVRTLSKTELMQTWWNARQWVGKDKRLYAISVGKK